MKKLAFAASLMLLTVMLFSMTACGYSGKIESVNDYNTIYRYKVEKVELLDADYDEEDDERVLTSTKDFKYYYSTYEYEVYKYVTINGNDSLQYYFPDLLIVSKSDPSETSDYGSYCKDYNTNVKVRIVLGKINKAYRPSYKVKGNVVTIEYYKCFSLGNAYKKQINYKKIEKLESEIQKKMYELRNDPEGLEAYEEEMKEKYLTTAYVYKTKIAMDLYNNELEVVYHN